jgi:hypothetical protein
MFLIRKLGQNHKIRIKYFGGFQVHWNPYLIYLNLKFPLVSTHILWFQLNPSIYGFPLFRVQVVYQRDKY